MTPSHVIVRDTATGEHLVVRRPSAKLLPRHRFDHELLVPSLAAGRRLLAEAGLRCGY